MKKNIKFNKIHRLKDIDIYKELNNQITLAIFEVKLNILKPSHNIEKILNPSTSKIFYIKKTN